MTIHTLSQVVFIHLDFHLWSGARRLRPEDLKNLSADQIPPATLASLGSKKLCNPEDLAPGQRLKRQAERACELQGFRFLGHFAVPEPRLDAVVPELDAAVQGFQDWRADFLARYESLIDGWASQHPGWEDIIRRAVEPAGVVGAKLTAGYQIFRIAPPHADPDHPANAGLAVKADSLGDRLLESVAQEAQDLWRNSLEGRDEVTQRALSPVRTLRDKLAGWALVDPAMHPLVGRIDACLAALPQKGILRGNDLNALTGLVFLLSDPARMKHHGQAVLKGPPVLAPVDFDVTDAAADAAEIPVEVEAGDSAPVAETVAAPNPVADTADPTPIEPAASTTPELEPDALDEPAFTVPPAWMPPAPATPPPPKPADSPQMGWFF